MKNNVSTKILEELWYSLFFEIVFRVLELFF